MTLYEKVLYIQKTLGFNRNEFINKMQSLGSTCTRQTINNLKNTKTFPSIGTLDTIIKVCKDSNNKTLNNISYDYLLDENVINISNKNINISKELKLTDTSISKIYELNENNQNELNVLLENLSIDFWKKIKINSTFKELHKLLLEFSNTTSDILSLNLHRDYEVLLKSFIKDKSFDYIFYTKHLLHYIIKKPIPKEFIPILESLTYTYNSKEKNILLKYKSLSNEIYFKLMVIANSDSTFFDYFNVSDSAFPELATQANLCYLNNKYLNTTLLQYMKSCSEDLLNKLQKANTLLKFQISEDLSKLLDF